MKIEELKKGDLYKLENNVWSSISAFSRIGYYNDEAKQWEKQSTPNNRLCLFGNFYDETNNVIFIGEFAQWLDKGHECFLQAKGAQ